jgi:hypothetical protein
LLAHADVIPTNIEHVKKSIELFGGVYIGLALPNAAQGKMIWDVSTGPDSVPGSWGGHAVFVPKYSTASNGKVTFYAVSWGELYEITEAFWLYNDPDPTIGPYIDEVHALVAPEFLNLKTGDTPEGLDLATLESDLKLVIT